MGVDDCSAIPAWGYYTRIASGINRIPEHEVTIGIRTEVKDRLWPIMYSRDPRYGQSIFDVRELLKAELSEENLRKLGLGERNE